MNTEAQPIVFLAFANDRQRDGIYLRNLAQEAAQIRAKLEAVPHLCQVIERHGVTPAQILEIFRKNKDRIAIFHYAGHAEDFELLLETGQGERTRADARGLLEFLRQQRGLRLVFLNACSTRAQVEAMYTADVPAVIATSRAVDDTVATAFAANLYAGLAAGDSLAAAYATAQAAVQFTVGDVTRHLRPVENPYQEHADAGWPWGLYVRPGSEAVRGWNLPDAAGDPLFGLPSLPLGDLPASPFRNILWFRREDAPVFFGRGYDIRELFQRITAVAGAPILLYYGQSGVGKSSLLAAGLLPRLEQVQSVVCVRRDQAAGLLGTLEKSVPAVFVGHGNVAERWRAVESETGRPLTVILDQVEEVYTRSNKDNARELSDFLDVLGALVADPAARPRGRVVLSFRKEYLQELGDLLAERRLPRAEVSLKRLDRRGIIEAVTGPARSERLQQHFGLHVDEGLADKIADDLLGDPSSAVAPTLQILLSKLWTQAKACDYAHPAFDRPLYDDLHHQGLLLSDFLDQQLAELRSTQPAAVASGLALDLLAFHTTSLGTAEQHTLAELRAAYAHQTATLGDLVAACRDRFLLVDPVENRPTDEGALRLAHDTLAPLVRRRFEESDAPGQRARRILESRLPAKPEAELPEQRQGLAPLGDADLAVVEAGRAGMRAWRVQEEDLVAISREDRERRLAEQARIAQERERVLQELLEQTQKVAEEQRLRAEENAKAARALRKRFRIALGAAISAVILLVVAGFATQQFFAAQGQAWAEARRARSGELAALAVGEIDYDPELGILLALEAISTTQDLGATAAISPTQTTPAEDALRRAVMATNAITMSSHSAPVMALSFSPDGKRLVTGDNLVLRIWDVATKSFTIWSAHDTFTTRIAHDPTGVQLATAHAGFDAEGDPVDGTIQLWDVETGKILRTLTDQKATIFGLDYSPDGQLLASASLDGSVRIWNVLTGDSFSLPVSAAPMWDVAFSPDGRFLAAVGKDGRVTIWNLTDRQVVASFAGEKPLYAVDFSPDGTVVAIAGSDPRIRLWRWADDEVPRTTLTGHTNNVFDLDFSPDGKRLVSAGQEGIAIVWDVSDLSSGAPEVERLRGHQAGLWMATYDATGQVIATGGDDGTVRLWSAEAHNKPITDMSFGPVASGLLATAGLDNVARVWRFEDGKLSWLRTLEHSKPVRKVVFSADGQTVATASEDKSVRIWDPLTGEALHTLDDHTDAVLTVAFSPDTSLVASAGADKTLRIWEVATGVLSRTIPGFTSAINDVVFTPDSDTIVTVGKSTTDGDPAQVRLVRLSDGSTEILTEDAQDLERVAVSPDGRFLAFAGASKIVTLWDVYGERLAYTMTGHADRVFALAFDDSSTRLATAGGDGQVFVWDTASGEQLQELPRVSSEISAVDFSPDGKFLVLGGHTGRVYAQALVLADLQGQASRLLTRGWRLADCERVRWEVGCPGRQQGSAP
jgi:WD40 repeat protein